MRSTDRRRIAGLVSLGVAVGGLAPLVASPAQASPDGSGLVISEVYGGGGNSGAAYANDFVEILNPTSAPISLAGLSVQYRSSGGTGVASGVTALSGSLAAGASLLVQEGTNGAVGSALPTPDVTGTINLSATNGTVFIAKSTSAIAPAVPFKGSADVVDLVGYGTSNTFETKAAPAGTNSTSLARGGAGKDTDDNSADLTAGGPTPKGTGGSGGGTGGDVPPAPDLTAIAAIQGTGTTTPLSGQSVRTQGVVTASYPTGGLKGFYLQTAGTGGDDTTPNASDAIFVYAPTLTSLPAVGDSVEVTGKAGEFSGLTQITVAAAGDITAVNPALAAVTPRRTAWYTTDAEREAHEGELVQLTDDLTVTNSYNASQYGEIGLATGTTPLIQPTEVRDFQTGAPEEITAQNARRLVTVDDGKSENFYGAASSTPSSYVDATHPVRVGATATLKGAFVLDYRNSLWKLQPRTPVTGLGDDVATFADTRTPAPEAVGGDVHIATFNVLNFFPTTGADIVAAGGSCTYYDDRAGNHVTVNTCTTAAGGSGPRGAADAANHARQRAKIVAAINALGAGIVSLEELENSAKFGPDRDAAIKSLVASLNADAGSTVWDYVPSPTTRPALADEDVIRTGFIYKPALVTPVGASLILDDQTNFDNAREPLAQAFKKTGDLDANAFAVIVNHFKSKGASGATGENTDQGQGAWNADRIGQAKAVAAFADTVKQARSVSAVFLVGDFNSYSEEDPIQVLEDAGYGLVESSTPGEETYSFSGLSGSLDHVLANGAAKALVTGADIWNINSVETVGFQYSRYNNNVTDLYRPNPYGASDHDPEIVGITFPKTVPATASINLLNINDFHGRIDANTTRFATTIERLRAEEGDAHTLFLSAGDNIGASLFASAVQQDAPAIDVLNALGLRTSAVGNHEFDRGFADLQGRVSDRADFDYLGANVYKKGTTTPALPEYATFQADGLTVGVIGTVTQETPTLVSPDGVANLDFGDPVAATNRVAAQLSDGDPSNGEADVIVAEYHEGAGDGTPEGASLEQEIAAGGAFADIATKTSAKVDVIFTGHTHKQYAWDGPIPGVEGKTRPILQTGSYGENIGQVRLTVDRATDEVTAYAQRNVARSTTEDLSFPRVAKVKQITDAALANAAQVGNQPVGSITADITTAYAGGARDDRSRESTLGGLVADALKEGIKGQADVDLGITNPGGLRAELLYQGDTTSNPANTDGVVTYAEANAVLPFNNTVAVVTLTGAQLKDVLEQQWQTDANGNVPSRPYLQLGLSRNVAVTADPTKAAGSRITSVRIDGKVLDPKKTYKVSTLTFLAAGGDNFRAFKAGSTVDTGLLDAQLWRDYLAAQAPVKPDYARRQVFSTDLPASLQAGVASTFTLGVGATTAPAYPLNPKTLDLTSLGAPANTAVTATLRHADGTTEQVGQPFTVTDGLAKIDLTLPRTVTTGDVVELKASPSGTTVTIPAEPAAAPVESSITATADDVAFGQDTVVKATVTPATATGSVEVREGDTLLGTGTLADGTVTVTIKAGTLAPGSHDLTVRYLGDDATAPSSTTVTTKVGTQASVVTVTPPANNPVVRGSRTPLKVEVTAGGEPVADGIVAAFVDGTEVDRATLRSGKATLLVGPFATAGREQVQVRYLGTDEVAASSRTISLIVRKADSFVSVSRSSGRVVAGTTKVFLRIAVDAQYSSLVPRGRVTITADGRTTTATLDEDGRVLVRIAPFAKAGPHTVVVRYAGSGDVNGSSAREGIYVSSR